MPCARRTLVVRHTHLFYSLVSCAACVFAVLANNTKLVLSVVCIESSIISHSQLDPRYTISRFLGMAQQLDGLSFNKLADAQYPMPMANDPKPPSPIA